MELHKLEFTVGGFCFTADVPLADVATKGVEIRYLIAFEREIVKRLCEKCDPSPDGFAFLRSRSGYRRAHEVAAALGATPEAVDRWESDTKPWEKGKRPIPTQIWERLQRIAIEYAAASKPVRNDVVLKVEVSPAQSS